MKHLSGLDASFLHLETPEMPMHVGGLCLFDLPAAYHGKDAKSFYDEVKEHVRQRMHLASVFTKKLAFMPFDLANPMWIDASDIDLDYHVRQITLPKPGTMVQLEAYVGRLHSSLLDRSRPLWEFYIFDGLQSGQAAFYSKVHHAALDGQGAAVMAQALLDFGPVPRVIAPPPEREPAPYQPQVRTMLKAAMSNTATQCLRLLKGVPDALKVAGSMLMPSSHEQRHSLGLGPRTLLNVSITNQRSFSTLALPVDEVKLIGQAFGGTLNDAVLAICSGALRDYLASKGESPQKPLLAALPVSLREAGNTDLNNQVSMMQMSLASNIADPAKRMHAIVKASAAMKHSLKSIKSIMPTDFPSLGLPWLMSGLVSLYGRSRLADSIPPLANVCISNVPGPRMPLFLAGAQMVTNFPVSIVAHGMALNITVQSYNGNLDFGLIACRRAMPDLANLATLMQQAHQQLLSLGRAMLAEAADSPEADAAQERPPRKPAKTRASSTKAKALANTAPSEPAADAAITPGKKPTRAKRVRSVVQASAE
ncbi:MAG: hypothetical protein RL748_1072 [Pseudomonadota bacterium]|jgi:WS/DGAT/MGAT family acyltransferase